jgi:hypothetical protein
MHHESEWGPRPERECGDEVHILGKKIEPVWPFLDGLGKMQHKMNEADTLFTYSSSGPHVQYVFYREYLVSG